MAYDDYDGYGDESEDYQDIEDTSSGFQIGDGGDILRSSGSSSTDEASLEELLMQGELLAKEDQDIGTPTGTTLQLGRIGHVEYRVQEAIRDALQGNLDASKAGLSDINVAAAVERFSSITGEDPTVFANKIKGGRSSAVYSVDASGNRTRVKSSYSKQDLKTAVSMLGNTAGEYLNRGPGSTLPSNYLDEEKKLGSEEALKNAYGAISDIAELYIPEATKTSKIYGLRKRQVEEALTKRLMDGNFYKDQNTIMPLPNELGVAGIIPTMSYWKGYSSPFNRLSFEAHRGEIDDDEIFKYMPSVADSLFKRPRYNKSGMTDSQIAAMNKKQKRDQQFRIEDVTGRAYKASKVLREAFPTMSNESYGSERYMTKGRHEDDWGDRAAAMDEAAYFDLERANIDAVSSRDKPRDLSEQERFISGESLYDILEEAEPEEYIKTYAEGSHGSYQKFLEENPQPEQRSPEWFKRRKGLITGSKVSTLTGKMGSDKMAVSLAAERLGMKDPYNNLGKFGNAYTEMGKEAEAAAERSFLRGPGRGLSLEPTFLETNPSMSGFGATPDGRLFNDDGSSAGLLELKYLGDSTFDKALKEYTPQAQLQMAVGEEDQTHLYILNRETGESMHHIIKADKTMQSDLLESGKKALELSQGLSASGMEDLMSKIKLGSRKKRNAESGRAGKEAKFVESNTDAESPMSAFDENANAVVAGRAENTLFATKLKKVDQASKMKDAVDMADMSKVEAASKKEEAQARKMVMSELAAYKEDADRSSSIEEEAMKRSAEAVKNFSNAVKKATGVLGEMASVALAGNKSAMDEIRLAAESGISVEKLRGTREALEFGGLSDAGINSVVGSAASQMQLFNDPAKGADEYTRQIVAMRRSNLPELANLDVPLPEAQGRMDIQQRIAMVSGMMEGKSAEARSFIASTYNMGALAANTTDPSKILNAFDEYIDEEGTRAQRSGELSFTQKARAGKEFAGSLGETTGTASSGLDAVSGTAIGGVLGAGAMKLLGSRGVTAASAVKSLSAVGKANPLTAAASLAPMAVRHLTGVKDDGSFADSAMDVLEFASAGAAIGSMVPVVGTAVGGAVGAGIGLVNEFFEEDQLPSSSIGGITTPVNAASNDKIVNNITVTNEISPDLITTKTNINGDLDEDAEVLQ